MEKLLTPHSTKRRKHLDGRQSELEAQQRGEKRTPEDSRRGESRTAAQRDRDRILYCSALQRLAYVTQVTPPESGYTFHNRLSHSLKVAQVGRRHAERLQKQVKLKQIVGGAARLVTEIDPDSIEAACLAHDLGHPPFGHLAEGILNRDASKFVRDGFEGNAQSFRIVTRLAVRNDRPGLDLTRRTLDAVLKYPWQKRKSDRPGKGKRTRKWGYYDEDATAYKFAREGLPPDTRDAVPERCLEAEIMDWADDLTYAVHDMDDFFRAGLIPLDRLNSRETPEFKRFKELLRDAEETAPGGALEYEVDVLAEAARQVISRHSLDEAYRHTQSARAAMREFGSNLITDYLDAFSLENVPGSRKVKLRIDEELRREVEALKMLVTVFVVRHPGLAVVQHGQERVIADLFRWYFEASQNDRRLFPPGAKERLDGGQDDPAPRARVVVDLIAGLTETSAIQLHRRLSGGWTAPTLDATAMMG